MNHEPEDLPRALTIVPSRAGEQARMKKRVQSSGSFLGLGDFFIWLGGDDIQLSLQRVCLCRGGCLRLFSAVVPREIVLT